LWVEGRDLIILRVKLASVLLAIALLAAAARAAEPAPRKGVLLLYDENGDFTGLANLDRSLKASLGNGIPEGLDVYTEFMDVSRFAIRATRRRCAISIAGSTRVRSST